MEHTVLKFISFTRRVAYELHEYNKVLCIEMNMTPKVFLQTDCEAYNENLGIRN